MIRMTTMLFLCLAASLPAQEKDAKDLQARADKEVPGLIPPAEGKVDVMGLVFPPRLVELTKRMQAAIAKDPAWWMEHVKKAEPGKPVSYDPKLGLTKEEFEEFLAAGKKYTLAKQSESTMKVASEGDKVKVLQGGAGLAALTGIKLDLAKRVVVTPHGTCGTLSEIRTPDDFPFPWDGYQWLLEEAGDPLASQGKVVKFAIGKLRKGDKRILYYRVMGFQDGVRIPPVDLTIEY